MSRPPHVSRHRLHLALSLAAIAAMLAACVSQGATVAEPPANCTKLGDTCTFSPGKLGLCVESTNDSAKLVCQSQH